MTATHEEFAYSDVEATDQDGPPQLRVAPDAIEVRRSPLVCGLVGLVSSGLAFAWLQRAISTGSLVSWGVALGLGLLGVFWLRALLDARTPLLVADSQGLRARVGGTWLGLPWSAIRCIEHRPRGAWGLRDGLLNVLVWNDDTLVSDLADADRAGRRQASLASRWYGGPLALPLGLTTRITGLGDDDLGAALTRLAGNQTEVHTVGVADPVDPADPTDSVEAIDTDEAAEKGTGARVDGVDEVDGLDGLDGSEFLRPSPLRRPVLTGVPDLRPRLATALNTLASLVGRRVDESQRDSRDSRDDDALNPEVTAAIEADDPMGSTGLIEAPAPDDQGAHEALDPTEPSGAGEISWTASAAPEPVRDVVPPVRVELRHERERVHTLESAQVDLGADGGEGDHWGDRVRPIAVAGDPVGPLSLDEHMEPANDPIIGPDLRAARTRLGLDVEELAERTRIRAHVIEGIEVDDFDACGGDFYARGHLRTLARVLGVDAGPLLQRYDERYAHAPIDPKRVFEAELATGLHSSLRSTRGGPNWSILVAAVMAVILIWSIARLVMDAPAELRNPAPVLNGSGGPHAAATVVNEPVAVTITAGPVGARVVVRDATGAVVFNGNLAIGEARTLKAAPPVRVQSSDGSASVSVAGTDRGPIGVRGEAGQRTYSGD